MLTTSLMSGWNIGALWSSCYVLALLILLIHSDIGSGICPLVLGIRHLAYGIITCSLHLVWYRVLSSHIYWLHVCLLDIASMILIRHKESTLRCWSWLYLVTRFCRKHLRNDFKSTLGQSFHLLPLDLIEIIHVTIHITIAFLFLLHNLSDNLWWSRLRWLDNYFSRRRGWWIGCDRLFYFATFGFLLWYAFTHVDWVTSQIAIPVMIAAVLLLVALDGEWVASTVPFMCWAARSILAH